MKIYLAGPMRNKFQFNQKAFNSAAVKLRSEGHEVFSPSENTRLFYGDDIYKDNPAGIEAQAGINGRLVFSMDCAYICLYAEAVALLPGWRDSLGACAEKALGEALGLRIMEL